MTTCMPPALVDTGSDIYGWAAELFPICRSLSGDGLRQTLGYLQDLLPGLRFTAVPSGTQVFDWTVPNEWNIRDAFVADESGERIIDFRQHNLHVMGYSEPIDQTMSFAQLEPHLHHLPSQPNAIPYVTSYYGRNWGFCLSHHQFQELQRHPERRYHVCIDSTLCPGEINYAELVIPGATSEEIFFSTYVCHPSMANNELSGPCVQTALARWIQQSLPDRRFTYRFFFGPETIGPIAFLSRHLAELRANMRAGFVLSCLGDERTYSYQASREANTLADRVARHVLSNTVENYQTYSFLDRGSDERQYCSPGVDLPVCTLSRSKFMTYPEYHTSLDDMSVISAAGLEGSLLWLVEMVKVLEANQVYRCVVPCEPQLGKRGLYPSLSTKDTRAAVRTMMDFLAYADGKQDLIGIAETIGVSATELLPVVEQMLQANVIESVTGG